MTTPKLGMPELSVSQASKEITHNQALAILDQTSQLTVVSRTNTPPGSPADGAAYIVTATATGAWAGKEGQIAYWLTAVAAWQFIAPANGWLAWSNADSKTYRREAGAWVELSTGGGGVSLAQVVAFAGTSKTLALTDINTIVDCTSSSAVIITIPPQSSVTWTADAEIHVRMSGTGQVSIAVGSGVTIPPLTAPYLLQGQGAIVTLKRRSSDVWALIGGPSGGQLGAFRNKLINANFQINQRAYVTGTATTTANQYTLDRWRVVTSGQNLAFSASGNGNQITAPAGGVEQVIEGIDIEGGTYVLNWTGTATATVNGTARAKGETFTLTANTNATVRFIGGTVSVAQLEAGSVATPFEHRPYGVELALCQRYYEVLSIGLTNGAVSAAGQITGHHFKFAVSKRAAPTVAMVTGTDIQTAYPTGPASFSIVTIDGVLAFKNSTAANANANWYQTITVSAEL